MPMSDYVPTCIAVTGMNARPDNPGPGVAVARCLREANNFAGRIVGLGYEALDPGLYLPQYSDAAYLLPYPSTGDAAFMERIVAIAGQEHIDALIPCLDAELPSICRLQDQLAGMGVATFVPNQEQLSLRNKDRLEELAEHAGIDCPDTRAITSIDFFRQPNRGGWKFPMVVKGIFYDAAVVHNETEAVAAFERISRQWGLPVLVQKFLDGEEVNLTAIGDGEGRLLGAVMMKKLAVTDKGKAWAGITIADEQLYEASRALVAATRWRGPLEVEVMITGRHDYHLIEINPRFPAWIYLSHGAGSNLLELLLKLIAGQAVDETGPAPAGVLYIRHAEDNTIPLAMYESVVVRGSRVADRPETEAST
jgi:carbamoyl-phosphate synthase large subunit